MINGRPTPLRGEMLAGMLQQWPADVVERIEVIPNPSARYDPDGMSGIINIVMKQNQDLGLNGGISAGMGTWDKYNVGGNINYQKGKLNLFANYGFRDEQRSSEGINFREDRFRDPTELLFQNSDGTRGGPSHLLNLNLDYNGVYDSTALKSRSCCSLPC